MSVLISEYFFYYFVLFSLSRFILVIILSNQTPVCLGESRVRLLVNAGCILDMLHLLGLLILHSSLSSIIVKEFLYFSIDFKVTWTAYSIAYLIFSVVLINIVARFSLFYLHRDNYFFKFFSLLYILELAVILLVVTVSSESLFIGWELLGISSVLLIAFYEHKPPVLKNSLTILVIYKISDVVFYSMLIITTSTGGGTYLDNPSTLTLILVLISCLIKSSVFPWIWLPRAMEGPTPSSAIFYGGVATHVPIFIFLNIWSNSATYDVLLQCTAIVVILLSSVTSSFLSKQSPDVKNAIAYASITQIGLIYIEIILGFYTLAVFHSIANGVYRSVEFLTSPSLLYNYHSIECSRKGKTSPPGFFAKKLIPTSLQNKMYWLSYHEFILSRWLITIIQNYLGLHASRASKKALKTYFIVSLSAFIGFELAIYCIFDSKITIFDEFLLLIAFVFNVFAMMYKYHPMRFFISLCASVFAVFVMLIEHINSEHSIIDGVLVVLVIILGFNLIKKYHSGSEHVNYQAREFRSSFSNFVILFLGVSLVGIPGLFSFIIWEHLEDHLIHSSPDLIVDGFFIMALNTIVFFRFYYANYLGGNKNHYAYLNVSRR